MDIVQITTTKGTYFVTSNDLEAPTGHLTNTQLITYALSYFNVKYNDPDVESIEINCR